MNVGLVSNTFSGITNGQGALASAKNNADSTKFADLIKRLQSQNDGRGTVSSEQIAENGRLNGDYSSGLVELIHLLKIKFPLLLVPLSISLIHMFSRKQLTAPQNCMKNQWN